MKVESERVSFSFNVYNRLQIRPMIEDVLSKFVGDSFDENDWVAEVDVETNSFHNADKIWTVNVDARYVGRK